MRSLKILLVEDNEIFQQIQAHMLTRLGHEVVTASSAQKALATLKLFAFDVILMDLVMPEMDGFECAREIKAMNVQTPIVALSGNDSQETKDACFEAGMSGYLKKPTDKDTFEFMMQQVLAQ
ncbi:response regulator [Thiomicrorhabdus xiamenensis]|uniref:Response regulator n=1 Tax=Thiomicrorhabdus xiamenensis TaxID=2739063 RepID=A0A7D4SXF3_9GAMM|nr:response regulator [Thiomicrorhabdus xiamenensis]QKI88284.1 response regulator [Thiomicrorhabdus xiamenensis]